MKYFVLIGLIVCVCVSPVWAETDTALMAKNRVAAASNAEKKQLMISMMQQHKYKTQTMAQARNMVMEAKKKGLPVDPIVNKAFEGMAKGVPEDAIIRAMNKMKSRYAYAYKVAGQFQYNKKQKQEIGDTIADCMTAGMTEKDMEKIMAQLRLRVRDRQSDEDRELVEESVHTARTMSRMGVPSDLSGEIVSSALENQFSAQDMKKMQIRFREQARVRAASIVADEYCQGLSKGANFQELGRYGSTMGGRKSGSGSYGAGNGAGSGNGSGSSPGAGSRSSSGSGGHGGGGRGGRNR